MIKTIDKLITKSEKILKLDIKYFSKNSFYILLKQGITGFFGFLLSFTLARTLTRFTFGEYNLFLSILGVLSIFSLPGMLDAILNSVVKGFDHSYIEGTRLSFKASFLSFPLIFLIALFYFLNNQPTVSLLLLTSVIFFPFYNGLNSFEYFLTAKEKFFEVMLSTALLSFAVNLVTLLVALFTGKIFLIVFAFLLVNAVVKLSIFSYTRRLVKKGSNVDPEMKRFGLFLTLLSGFSQIVNNFDRIILGYFSGLSSLALFSIANILPSFIEKTFYSLQGIMTPKIIKEGKRGNRETIKRHLIKIIFLSIFVFLVIYFAAPFFIKIFFGAKYEEAIKFSQLLSVQLVFSLANSMLGNIITFQQRSKSMIFFTFYPALPRMILYLILIPKFGILGLILSLLVSKFLAFSGLLVLNLKKQT